MRKFGFTLIELSIVLVIIGLVVGGILTGSALVRSTKIRTVIADIERFDTAVHTFKSKYGCLPGDCKNATAYFGTDTGNCATGTVAVGTCNGDNNGHIGLFGDSVGWDGSEFFLAWQQLALAGLVEGSYSGTSDSHDMINWKRASLVGWNIPASKIETAGYLIMHITLLPPDYSTSNINSRWQSSGHWIFFGNPLNDPYRTVGAWYEPSGHVISATDARSLDMKIDDGLPNLGSVLTIYTDMGSPECVDVSAEPAYMSGDTIACSLQFKASF